MRLREHSITLHGTRVTLRPMTENDWALLLAWNSDPEVLYWADDSDVTAYDLATVQSIYRSVSQNAICFIIECNGRPIGEGWLQRMNLERILAKYPTQDCRRIDLMIGAKEVWGQRLGTDTIHTLTCFGFEQEKADLIFGLVSDYNTRSRRAFARVGYVVDAEAPEPPGGKTQISYDLMMTRAMWEARRA
jgi:aminoglycoside 6'-N-acetyltransferase